MKVRLGKIQKEHLKTFFKKLMVINDLELDEKIQILEENIQTPFMSLKPVNVNEDWQEIDHSKNDRTALNDITRRLDKIEKLAQQLTSEFSKLEQETRCRARYIIGSEMCSIFEISGNNKYRNIEPEILSKLLEHSARQISDDYKIAYKGKYTKYIDSLVNYWCTNIDKNVPTVYRGTPFINFLMIVCDCSEETAYSQYRNYSNSGMNPPIIM